MNKQPEFIFPRETIIKIVKKLSLGITLLGVASLVAKHGFNLSSESLKLVHFSIYFFSILLALQFWLRLFLVLSKKKFLEDSRIELILISCWMLVLFLLSMGILPLEISPAITSSSYLVSCQVLILLYSVMKAPYVYRLLSSLKLSPPLTVVTTFLLIIAVGTLLLLLPHATVPGKSISYIDALFTAASATCVTGLIVVDTGTHFSIFGQLIVLTLIQIGGLGLMAFASLFALTASEFGVRERLIIRDIIRFENLSKIGYLVLFIFAFTIIFEVAGAIFLYFQFLPLAENNLQAAYSAIFHSVSAFCNAGFSLYADSFMGYQSNVSVNIIMTSLIIGGGLGFVVILNMLQTAFARIKGKKKYLSLHSKLVITTTLALIGLGMLFLYIGESGNLLKELSIRGKILAAYFQSVTARTAGFHTIHIGSLTTFASFFLIILMFIGASPGSTGGGIKTSTFTTLILTIKSIIQGKDEVETFKRTIPRTIVYQTLSVATLAFSWIGIATLFLSFTENFDFLAILFEVFSAFGTVGLSRGITPQLTSWGKMIIIVTVLVGRIGPLTLALAIAGKSVVKHYQYPHENIVIG